MSSGNSGFDPRAFVKKIQVGGRNSGTTADYLEVKCRLLWVRAEHPDAHMESRLARLDGDLVVMSAKVCLSNGAEAMGHGSCRASEADAVEKAETAALGRALAALGYGTQFALYEESRVVDAPAERREAAGGVPREVMPADPRVVATWFRKRVLAMPAMEHDEVQVRTAAEALATALHEAGLSTRQRGWLYLSLTGKASGAEMDPRQLALLAQMVDRAEVLRAVADAYGEAEMVGRGNGRNGRH